MSPLIYKLGLLHETGSNVPSYKARDTFLCFQHKTLQERSAADYVSKRIRNGVSTVIIRDFYILLWLQYIKKSALILKSNIYIIHLRI